MTNAIVPLEIPEAEVTEAREAGLAFVGNLPPTATGKQILAAVANEVIRKWRAETKPPAKGQIT